MGSNGRNSGQILFMDWNFTEDKSESQRWERLLQSCDYIGRWKEGVTPDHFGGKTLAKISNLFVEAMKIVAPKLEYKTSRPALYKILYRHPRRVVIRVDKSLSIPRRVENGQDVFGSDCGLNMATRLKLVNGNFNKSQGILRTVLNNVANETTTNVSEACIDMLWTISRLVNGLGIRTDKGMQYEGELISPWHIVVERGTMSPKKMLELEQQNAIEEAAAKKGADLTQSEKHSALCRYKAKERDAGHVRHAKILKDWDLDDWKAEARDCGVRYENDVELDTLSTAVRANVEARVGKAWKRLKKSTSK